MRGQGWREGGASSHRAGGGQGSLGARVNPDNHVTWGSVTAGGRRAPLGWSRGQWARLLCAQQTEIIDCIRPYTENLSYSLLLRLKNGMAPGLRFQCYGKLLEHSEKTVQPDVHMSALTRAIPRRGDSWAWGGCQWGDRKLGQCPRRGWGFVEGGGVGGAEVKCMWGHGQSGQTEWV